MNESFQEDELFGTIRGRRGQHSSLPVTVGLGVDNLLFGANGCRMDREALDRLFEPFCTTEEVGKATGLEPSTVYGSVKQIDSFINVYTEPAQGTTL